MVIYLYDIPENYGGETAFWHLKTIIQPVKNSAVLFNNLMKNRKTGHQKTLHFGEKLLTHKLEKWAINCWVRLSEYPF